MQLLSVELKEFGRHKHLQFACDSPVLGLIGPSGGGKSTVLEAVKIAFTGIGTDDLDSYVRNWGLEGGANNGSVRIKFRKNGMEGEIFRQIGKSPKCKFLWDGKEYTKVREMEPIMADILGADKQAISTAVFIKQGELDKLLFGSQAEREQLFVKLMLIGYLEKTSAMIDARAKALSSTLVDQTPRKDEVEQQLAQATQKMLEIRERLNNLPNFSTEIDTLTIYLQKVEASNLATKEEGRLTLELRDKSQDITRIRETLARDVDYPPAKDRPIEQLREYLESLVGDCQIKQDRRAFRQRTLKVQGQLAQCAANIEAGQIDLNRINGEIGQFSPNLAALKAGLEATRDALLKKKTAEEEMLKLQSDIRKTQDAIEAAKAAIDSVSADEIQALGDRHMELNAQYSIYKLEMDILKQLLGSEGAAKLTHCPICASEVHDIANARKGALEVLEAKREVIRKEVTTITERRKHLTATKQTAIDALNRLTGEADKNSRRFTELLTVVSAAPPGSLEIITAQLATMAADLLSQQRLIAQRDQLVQNIRQSQQYLDNTDPDLRAAASASTAENLKQWIEVDDRDIDKAQKDIATIKMALTNLDTSERRLLELKGNIENAKKAGAQAYDEATAIYQSLPSNIRAAMDVEEPRVVIRDMQARQDAHQAAQGELKAVREHIEEQERRKREIDIAIAAEAGKKQLVDDLMRLRDMFSRRALPLTFVRHKFKKLAKLTNQDVLQMDTNFTVEEDPDKPVSFLFTRTDDDSGYVMPQEKLSGGQRVRLSVAFLLAFQKLVLRDVSFIVLDEPSLHLDAAGKEEMCELLSNLAVRFASSESQVIVSDHAPELEPAFTTLVRL